MLARALVEIIGTAVFLTVILSQGQAIPIGIALAAMIFFGGGISGANYNPAVSFMQLIRGSMDLPNFVVYVIAQLIGAYLAIQINNYIV